MPDLSGGGAERVAVNLANSFLARGFDVDMVLLTATGQFRSDLHSEVNVVDLQVSRLRWVFFPLLRYLRQAKPDVLLACMWPLTIAAVAMRALSRVRTRVVVAEHTTWSRSELLQRPTKGWQIRTSMRFIFPFADGIVAVSKGAAEDLAKFAQLDARSITVIYNPVVGGSRPSSTIPLAPSGWWAGPHRRLLAVGTLKPIKDYATLLNAFALLRHNVDAHLLILGEGECRAALEAQARQLGIENSVFMPGFVKDPAPYFKRAELHILSSTGEGFGNVIVEALDAGTPVVSTDCLSGPREILDDGRFGKLVPVGDAASLAAAIADSLSAGHDAAALSSRAQDFSIDKAAEKYLGVLLPETSTEVRK